MDTSEEERLKDIERCQATFKEHCTYPNCDCDRPEHSETCRCEICRFWS